MNELASMELTTQDGVAVASLSGEIDLSNAHDVELGLVEAAADGGLVVDLTALGYIDSAGLAMLQRITDTFAAEGRGIYAVAAEGSRVRRVLLIARMDAMFPLFHEVGEAIRSCTTAQAAA